MSTESEKKGIEASFKSMDTEEFLDIYFNRPIGYAWALFFKKLKVHPNVVTIFSIILGIGAGVMFYYPDMKHTLLGILLLMWANHYDSADGQLARLTGQKTQWGRMLDGFAGDIWFFTIYAAICLRLMNQPMPFHIGDGMHWGIFIWILAIVSGTVCHSKQCTLADYYRNIHLYFLKGKSGSELDNFKQQREIFYSLPWKGNFWWKAFLYFYGNYTRQQERMTPNFQQFYALVKEKYGDNIPQELRDEFRAASKPLMKYTNILTFNTRAIALYISLLIGEPWLYFVFEVVVMTSLFVYMRHCHEAICARLYHKYITKLKSKYRNIFLMFGIAAIVVMLCSFDMEYDELLANLRRAGMWLPAVVGLWIIIYLFNTLSWYIIIRDGKKGTPIPFWKVYKLTVSGFALNYATPVGLMGGEPYRIMELTPYVGASKATSSVILYVMMHIFSHFCFWFFSIFLYLALRPVDIAMGTILAVVGAVSLLAIYFFMKGYKMVWLSVL